MYGGLTTVTEGRRRLAVLVSGTGSNLHALLDASHDGSLPADVVLVVSDRHEAAALDRARDAGISAVAVPPGPGEERSRYDSTIAAIVAEHDPDLVVLAGWMRILTMSFLRHFPGQVVNLHPALPGELAGTNAIERAFDEARAGTRTATGVMVHLVPDEGVDDGPVLASVEVPIHADDTLDTLAVRMHAAEHELLVHTIADLCSPIPSAKG